MTDNSGDDTFKQTGDDILNGVEAAKAVGGLVQKVAQPLMDNRAEHAAERRLQAQLGEWASSAQKGARWYHPMLTLESFEKHREKNKGYFTLTGECTSIFGWAHLLYALNIRPEDKIVDWKLATEKVSPVETGDIHLEIPAELLWHVINIYRLYSAPDLRAKNADFQKEVQYKLSFGTFSVQDVNGSVEAKFSPRMATTTVGREITHYPFPIHQYTSVGGNKLRFPKDEVMSAYLLAINSGISQEALKFTKFDHPEDRALELVDRTKELVARLKTLRSSSWDKPYLVTPKWLDQADHIYRRITTDNGLYIKLPEDIVSALKADPARAKVLDDRFAKSIDWEDVAKKILRDHALLPKQELRLAWKDRDSLPIEETMVSQYLEHYMPEVMDSFGSNPQGSLKHTLSCMKEQACYLFASAHAGREIRESPGVVLEFSPGHRLWGYDCVVK